ncbi:MAG TPA: ATP-dependent 6-phosphofructokinase [Microlunatus sp.]|nr:ATP-dependent 6-phosphofructokinase [Microlunatus sp.]
MTGLADLQVPTLGEPRYDSPLADFIADRQTNEHYVAEDDRVILHDTVRQLSELGMSLDSAPSFEPGGPRRRLFFPPGTTKIGVVTCGGLCPGLNDVIRGLVMEFAEHYGISEVTGFRAGYAGLVEGGPEPITLTPELVHGIHRQGGTMLGTSRGAQDPDRMVDRLLGLGIDLLFVIGGDGSMRGAATIADAVARRGATIGVIGIPKTIDNDIPFIGQSFGFVTAFTEAARAINAAMVEAHSALGGVGLIKLMGRHAGFIACYAALANHVADFVLIPEVPFRLDGPTGFLACLEQRVKSRGSAVVVVAEGAGQEILQSGQATDASGNARLADIGLHLRSEIGRHFAEAGVSSTLKYIDPSYMIRSVPACPHDSVYCVRLAQAAAHAGMAGRTAMVVGRRHNRFIHVPVALLTSERNQVDPHGDLWLSVLESTAQPVSML